MSACQQNLKSRKVDRSSLTACQQCRVVNSASWCWDLTGNDCCAGWTGLHSSTQDWGKKEVTAYSLVMAPPHIRKHIVCFSYKEVYVTHFVCSRSIHSHYCKIISLSHKRVHTQSKRLHWKTRFQEKALVPSRSHS